MRTEVARDEFMAAAMAAIKRQNGEANHLEQIQ